jgi:hypothetical protein
MMKDFAIEYYTERDGEMIKTWIHIKAKNEQEAVKIAQGKGIEVAGIQEAD